MSASMVASFLVFVLAGIYATFASPQHPLLADLRERLLTGLILLLSAAFYYYFAAHLEVDETARAKLAGAHSSEWAVRILNQTLLFSLWFVGGAFGWGVFVVLFILLYVGYLVWDAIVWPQYQDKRLVALDICGLAVAIAFAYVYAAIRNGSEDKFIHMLLGVISMAYIGIIVAGSMLCKFNPFKKDYYLAPRRH